jgi:putative endonuclease
MDVTWEVVPIVCKGGSILKKDRQDVGKRGEEIAQDYLQQHHYTLVTTNFRCKLGEIDIIAKDKDVVVFVEVRTVTSAKFGPAYNTVTYPKQKQVKRVALFYISKHNLVNTQFRFDVIGITLNRRTGDYQLDHIQNAF